MGLIADRDLNTPNKANELTPACGVPTDASRDGSVELVRWRCKDEEQAAAKRR